MSRAKQTISGPEVPGVPGASRIRFDELDIAILNQLQQDSKITNAMLAKRVEISPTAALERVRKLEQAGVVVGYAARLDPSKVGKAVTAIVEVQLREHGQGRIEEFKAALLELEEVQAAWHVTGEHDFLIKVLVTDMDHYERFSVQRLPSLPNLGRVRTSFCLSAVRDDTAVPLDAVAPSVAS